MIIDAMFAEPLIAVPLQWYEPAEQPSQAKWAKVA